MKITEAALDKAMETIIPGMAVDRTDMKRALEAATADDPALDLLTKVPRMLFSCQLRDEILAFLEERNL